MGGGRGEFEGEEETERVRYITGKGTREVEVPSLLGDGEARKKWKMLSFVIQDENPKCYCMYGCINRLWVWDFWIRQGNETIIAQLNGCISAPDINSDRVRERDRKDRTWKSKLLFIILVFSFQLQCKGMLCIAFLAYIEGLVGRNTNKKTIVIIFYLFYLLQHVLAHF